MHFSPDVLHPVPPFDFSLSLRFLEGFTPAQGAHAVADGAITKSLRIDGITVAFRVAASSVSDLDAPMLDLEIVSGEALDTETRGAIARRVGDFLSIEDDLTPFIILARGDPAFAPIEQRLHGLHQVRFLTPFENLCWAVLSQRTSERSARRAKDAFVERFGSGLTVEGRWHAAFPQVDDLHDVTATDLEPILHNRRKARFLADVIEAWRKVDEEWLRTAPLAEVEAWLRSIDGVGPWSASFVLFRGLGRLSSPQLGPRFMAAIRATYGRHDHRGRRPGSRRTIRRVERLLAHVSPRRRHEPRRAHPLTVGFGSSLTVSWKTSGLE